MGGMPLAAIITIAIIAGVIVLIVAVTFALRARRHKRLSQQLVKRNDDQVHYVFVVNPSKPQAAQRRAHIEQFCRDKGLTDVEFIDTQLDKDGRACAKEALANGADVVVAVGGDGTVRTVASAMSGTGHAMGIIPIGTGNLFARNMGIPIDDIDAALTVATSHGSRHVDVGRLSLLDDPKADHGHAFLIIAGVGFDAAMIDDTDPQLKKNISWLAFSRQNTGSSSPSAARRVKSRQYLSLARLPRGSDDAERGWIGRMNCPESWRHSRTASVSWTPIDASITPAAQSVSSSMAQSRCSGSARLRWAFCAPMMA